MVLHTFRAWLRDWLFNHICNEDKKYDKYLNNRGIT